MQARHFPPTPDGRSPAGAEIRHLIECEAGGMIHSTGPDPLEFLCITMPPWPGDEEATVREGPWRPTAPDG